MDKHEVLKTQQVDPDNIVCKTCAFKNGGGMEYPHYTKSYCDIYPKPGRGKPHIVLFEGADCEFYTPE